VIASTRSAISGLPPVGTRLELRTPGRPATVTRVEDHGSGGATLLVAAPYPAPPAGTVQAGWASARGWWVMEATATAQSGRVPLWNLLPSSPPYLEQRRRYARAHVTLPVALLADTEARSASLLDISEGGARVITARPSGLVVGAPVTTVLTTDRIDVSLAGRTVRVCLAEGWLEDVAVSFDEPVPQAQAQALRREVLQWQLRERHARSI